MDLIGRQGRNGVSEGIERVFLARQVLGVTEDRCSKEPNQAYVLAQPRRVQCTATATGLSYRRIVA